jgi:MoxR-like ATPase
MDAQHTLQSLLAQLNTVIVGKPAQTQDCVACLLAGGHLLIDDVPGVGKTTLAHALARTFGLQFSRVQFTSDLMPSDLSGVDLRAWQGGLCLPPRPPVCAGAAGR